MRRWFAPQYRFESVLQLTPEVLRQLGIEALLLDVDGTLKRYRAPEVPAEMVAWIDALRASGVGLCLVSNGLAARIGVVAAQLKLPFVAKALKPLPRGCRRALRETGLPAERTAMVGDQLLADIPAARLAGLISILVEPIHPEEEPWFTRLKRPLERWLLGGKRLDSGASEER